MSDGSEAPVSSFQQKIESRQQVNEQEVGAAQAELAQINPQENKDMLSRLRQSIEGYFADMQSLSEPVRAKLEQLRNSLPTSETVMDAVATAAGNARDAGQEMFQDGVAATQDIYQDVRNGNFSDIPRKYPVATAVLAFTGLTWLSGKVMSWFDGKERDGFFMNFLKTAATVTGVAYISRLIQKYSAPAKTADANADADTATAPSEENSPSPSDTPSLTTSAAPASVPTAPSPATPSSAPATAAPAAAAPSSTPAAAPVLKDIPSSISFAEFQKGMDVAGYKVKVTLPDIITVNGKNWKLTHWAVKLSFKDVSWANDTLTIEGGKLSEKKGDREASKLNKTEALTLLNKIASSTKDIPILDKNKKPTGGVLKPV